MKKLHNLKRIFAFFVATAVTVSVMSGCGKKETKTEESDVPVISWYVPSDDQPDKQSVFAEANKIIEEKIGAKLDLKFIDYGAFNTRMQMLMAGGADFDLCFTGFLNGYQDAATKGGLMDITELIDKEAPKLRELIPDWFLKSSEINGRIFAIPNVQAVSLPTAVWVPDHVAERTSFKFPEPHAKVSITDFEPYLEEVKALDEEIYNFFDLSAFTSDKYEVIVSNVAIRKDGSSMEAFLIYETPEWIEGVEKIHEWYKKGYIRPDIATADTGNDQRLGKVGLNVSSWKPGDEINMENAYGHSTNAYFLSDPYVPIGNVTQTMIGIGRGSKNAEKAIKIIELMNEDKELYNLICFGIEGKHYNITEDGKCKLIEDSGYYPNHQWKYGNNFNAMVLEGMDIDVYEQTEKLNDEATKSPLLGFTIDRSKINDQIAQVSSIGEEYKAINTGYDAPENYMAEFRRRMDEAGQREILKEVQRQIDEFVSKNRE